MHSHAYADNDVGYVGYLNNDNDDSLNVKHSCQALSLYYVWYIPLSGMIQSPPPPLSPSLSLFGRLEPVLQ